MQYNAYGNVYTTSDGYLGDNFGKSWGFLTVEGVDKLFVYKGDCVVRGRIAAVQTLRKQEFNVFEDKDLLVVPVSEERKRPYHKDNCWRFLVKLNEIDYKLLTSDIATGGNMTRAKEIIAYLRRTVDGMDNDDTIYSVPEDFKVDLDEEVNL